MKIVDGGIEKGSDIIKYLCLGADLVAIGRPAIYGLGVNGSQGVSTVFEILKKELKTAMINGGFKNLKSFNQKRLILGKFKKISLEYDLKMKIKKNIMHYSCKRRIKRSERKKYTKGRWQTFNFLSN